MGKRLTEKQKAKLRWKRYWQDVKDENANKRIARKKSKFDRALMTEPGQPLL
jgi:hypothetical protein